MPINHFESIGFAIDSVEDIPQLEALIVEQGQRFPVRGGAHVVLDAGGGAQIWVQVYKNEVAGINPYFAGISRRKLRLDQRLSRTEYAPFDGAYSSWGDDPFWGDCNVVFDVPDFDPNSKLRLPAMADVELSAFAHELSCYPNDDVFQSSSASELSGDAASDVGGRELRQNALREVRWATESFRPIGTLVTHGPPTAVAGLSGRILGIEQRTNIITGRPFFWAQVKTLGGEIDIVADPALVQGNPAVGGVLSGTFWLTGRVLSAESEVAPPWQRLIQRVGRRR